MFIKPFALILATLTLVACMPNNTVDTQQEREETLDQDLDGDGDPIEIE